MSAPQKTSRWGSFLSQAVAGVEARLDNILAEEDSSSKKSSEQPVTTAAPAATAPGPPTPPTRSATPNKSANDRLQERLARAVASRNAASAGRKSAEIASTTSSPRPSSDSSRLPVTSATQGASPRTSLSVDETTNSASPGLSSAEVASPGAQADPTRANPTLPPNDPSSAAPTPRSSLQLEPDQTEKDAVQEPKSTVETQPLEDNGAASELYAERIALLEKALEEAQAQYQEELHTNIEQMDALQAKVQYLAREASQEARNAATNAPAGSLNKKLAEKDDQIAQLMLEGQKLASTEQKHRSIIKKLRTQIATGEKELNEQKIWRQKTDRELADLRRRLDASADLEKANEEIQALLSQSKREIDRLKLENEAKDRSVADLKNQLQEESEKAIVLAAKADTHQREAEQKKVKELEDTVAALEVEKGLAADRARLQIAEAREKADRASERAHAVELELKGEVQILERKLEALRASAEEASSSAVGDAQVKLLRQIESLQTQYSIASENWQGMEASLQARAASLEKERDEALRRESDMRRKARETVCLQAYLRENVCRN
jgi:TATA element modulatory factor